MATAIRIHQTGGPDALSVDTVDLGAPGPGEVHLRQGAVGVNYIDTYQRSGLYKLPSLPHGIGMAGAGEVVAVGPDVTHVAAGDRVCYGHGTPGAYADERIMPAHVLVKTPDEIADDVAAAMMLRGMTVQYLIRRTFPVQPGQFVLFHAAAGGVGQIACQWLKHIGARVIGTVGSDEKAEIARRNGCEFPIVYTRDNFREAVMEITQGAGVPVVYDGVGKAVFEDSIKSLSKLGMYVQFGNASGPVEPVSPLMLAQNGSLFMTRPTLMDYVSRRDWLEETAQDLFDVVKSGAVTVEIGQRYALTDAAQAHRDLEARKTVGSTVLIP